MRKRLAAAAVLGLLLPAVALAAAGEPSYRAVAADQQWAESGVLQSSDLSPVYQKDPHRYGAFRVPTCPGYAPDRSDLTMTGAAAAFYVAGGGALSSTVGVFQSQAEAESWWSRVPSAGFASCYGRALVASHPAGVRAKLVSAKALPVPLRFADRAALYRVAVRYTRGSLSVVAYRELMFFVKGRAQGTVMVLSQVRPCPCAVQMAQRMYAHLSAGGRS